MKSKATTPRVGVLLAVLSFVPLAPTANAEGAAGSDTTSDAGSTTLGSDAGARVESGAHAPSKGAKPTKSAKPTLDVTPTPANHETLLSMDAEASALAAGAAKMARGRPKEVLALLAPVAPRFLTDHLKLLEGEANLAVGDIAAAAAAFSMAAEHAQTQSTKRAALSGLLDVYEQEHQHEKVLDTVDLLLSEKSSAQRPDLLLRRALALKGLNRDEEAGEAAWRVVIRDPTSTEAESAQRLLRTLQRRHVKVPVDADQLEIAHIQELIRDRAYARAEASISALARRRPKLKATLTMQSAEILRRQNKKKEEEALLRALCSTGAPFDERPQALFRLGRIYLGADRDDDAIRAFDELKATYPSTPSAAEGEFLAGWIPYNAGNYAEATRRMLAFADARRRSSKRADALWFAGWAQYRAEQHDEARAIFERLGREHAKSPLAAHAEYWMGRIAHNRKAFDEARGHYREVLRLAPLSYYGFLASQRLGSLKERVVFTPPPMIRTPTTIAEAIALLGPQRPLGVDRAVALLKAGLTRQAMTELAEVNRFLRSFKDPAGASRVVEILKALGADDQAFRVALRYTKDSRALLRGDINLWTTWRYAYPNPFAKAVESAASVHKVDPSLVLAVMRSESQFVPWAKSPVGARGLMQLMPATAREIGRRAPSGRAHARNFRAPASNIWLGTWYLSQLLERYQGQGALAIGAYNAGPRAMDRWLQGAANKDLDEFVESIPYKETRRYVRRVLEVRLIYELFEGKPTANLLTQVKLRAPKSTDINF
ncbi:MAG: transglycosylase SLT domain-containing protein [Deltaproteobacteria bacterium]|nr:transglycosylase SLT domain-containing protein [Deltaproteobacteria bacterium]